MDTSFFGVMSSRVHVAWALVLGGRLGVGNDPRYSNSRCFNAFPFRATDEATAARIRDLGERLDAHRKARQELYPELTLTNLYNVLEKVRLGERLLAKDREIHEQGLVSVLAELHDELDRAVLEAYGWGDLAAALVGKPGGTTPCLQKSAEQEEAEEELLGRLVKLNAERAAEEAAGRVRWLRPEFQAPEEAKKARQGVLLEEETSTGRSTLQAGRPAAQSEKWPSGLAEQVRAVREALGGQRGPVAPDELARAFKGAKRARVAELLETLAELGQARVTEDGRYAS